MPVLRLNIRSKPSSDQALTSSLTHLLGLSIRFASYTCTVEEEFFGGLAFLPSLLPQQGVAATLPGGATFCHLWTRLPCGRSATALACPHTATPATMRRVPCTAHLLTVPAQEDTGGDTVLLTQVFFIPSALCLLLRHLHSVPASSCRLIFPLSISTLSTSVTTRAWVAEQTRHVALFAGMEVAC